jgi:hypothetical protein
MKVCKIKSYIFFFVLVGWLGAIILLSLLFSTSDVKEGFFPSEKIPFDMSDYDPVNGNPEGSSLSMFERNVISPDCCPSTYSTSNGCVCLTKDQLEQMRSRGGNRT